MQQLPLRLTGDRPQGQFRLHFPRAVPRLAPKNPFRAAVLADFRHACDGRKWRDRCWLKRQIMRAWVYKGPRATIRELAACLRYEDQGGRPGMPIPLRTVRWGVRMLKAQGFVSNVRRLGWNGPMLREFHAHILGERFITYGTQPTERKGVRPAFASRRESCRPTPSQSCPVTSPKSCEGRPSGFQLERKPQDLRRAENRRSSPPFFQGNPTQTTRYAQVGRLIAKAIDLRRAGVEAADLAEDLKIFAARNGIDYSHTPAGCNSPIVQAVLIAEMRLGDPDGRFAPFGARRRR